MVDDSLRSRPGFGDDHSDAEHGLQVVSAQFKGVEPFNWDIFDGFDRMYVLTYSASAQMIVRMLETYPFSFFECIFGYEEGLRQVPDLVKPHQFLNNPVLECALQLEDDRQQIIFEWLWADKAHFYVVKDNVAHAKLYLLETNGGERRRVIVGSANLSERAFGGKQPETLVVFDNDPEAWEHYLREYDSVKKTASDRIDMLGDLQAAGIGDYTYRQKRRQWPEATSRNTDLRESNDDDWEDEDDDWEDDDWEHDEDWDHDEDWEEDEREDDEKPTIATSTSAAREYAWQLEKEGKTQTEIANILNALGFTYESDGGPFTQQRVWHLLNPNGFTERESRLRGM